MAAPVDGEPGSPVVGEGSPTHFVPGTDPARVLTLTDGVFAIIITLLVLELHVPDLAAGQSLRDAIREVQPSFVAFTISFVVVAIAWAGHRDLFALIRQTDRSLVWLNIVYLFPLSIIPFGASLLARYDDDPVALKMYGILLLALTVARLAIWVYATGTHAHLLLRPIDRRSRRAAIALIGLPGFAYAIAIFVADRSPTGSLLIYAGVPVVYLISITLVRTNAPAGAAERDFT